MQGLRVYEQSGSRFFSSPVEVVFNQISVDGYLEWGAHGWFWEICLPREYYSICWLTTTVKAPGIPQEPALHLSEAAVFLLDF